MKRLSLKSCQIPKHAYKRGGTVRVDLQSFTTTVPCWKGRDFLVWRCHLYFSW